MMEVIETYGLLKFAEFLPHEASRNTSWEFQNARKFGMIQRTQKINEPSKNGKIHTEISWKRIVNGIL